MKHNLKVTTILVAMFFIAQLIGIFVAHAYLPDVTMQVDPQTGEPIQVKQYDIPYGLEPPKDVSPTESTFSIIIALAIAVSIMLLLMKFKAETFLRLWFLLVVIIGIALALNAFLQNFVYSSMIAVIIAVPLGILKIYHKNFILHNTTELLVYPGIATVFIPLLNIWAIVILLILISLWDMYAVWHSGVMQKMAKYHIEKLQIFPGFFVPYLGKKQRAQIKKYNQAKKAGKKVKEKKIDVNIAVLGGGDIIFPILLAGVVLAAFGILQALIIAVTSTIALAYLFKISEKGKFYPAMPFITVGALIGLGIVFALSWI